MSGDDLYSAANVQFFISEVAKNYFMPFGREVLPTIDIPSELIDEYNVLSVDLKTYYTEWMAFFLNGEADINDDERGQNMCMV